MLMVVGLLVLVISLMVVVLVCCVGEDLIEYESCFCVVFYQVNVGMFKFDIEGKVIEVNQVMVDIFDYCCDVLLQLLLVDLLMDGELVIDGVGCIDWDCQLCLSELCFCCCDGSLVWGCWSGIGVCSVGGGLLVFVIIEDVSQNYVLVCEIEYYVSYDLLIGLINWCEIECLLECVLLQVCSEGGMYVLCYINLDYFKLVNDSFGYVVGDQMLCSFVDYLVVVVCDGDWVGWLGVDEFVVFFVYVGQDEVKCVLQWVICNLGQVMFLVSEGSLQLSCSIGVVEVSVDVLDVNWLMSVVDSVCYVVKQVGCNCVYCFNENCMVLEEWCWEVEWLQGVSLVMVENCMVLYVQCIVCVGDFSYLYYEVLVCMCGSDGSLYLLGQFMLVVECYGMVVVLDWYVFGLLFWYLQVCLVYVWQLGLCNVNVLVQLIVEFGFFVFVCDLLECNCVLVFKLCFEIIEIVVISNFSQVCVFIDVVKVCGCWMVLDDFGFGLFLFGYLCQLLVDILKIDGVFVCDMDIDLVSYVIVCVISELGCELQMEVVVEWVEIVEVVVVLIWFGVQGLQGYVVE